MLLAAHGDCKAEALDNESHDALIRACEGGHVEVVKLLLEKGARHEFDSNQGREQAAALYVASQRGDLSVVSRWKPVYSLVLSGY